MLEASNEQIPVPKGQESQEEVIPPCPTRPPPIPMMTPEIEAERKRHAKLQRINQEKETKAQAKPPPPVCPTFQEDQRAMTIPKAEPKAKAPPPSLQDE